MNAGKRLMMPLVCALTLFACSAKSEADDEDTSASEDNLFGFNEKKEGEACKENSDCGSALVCRPTSNNHKGPTGLKCRPKAQEHESCDETADCEIGNCFVPKHTEQLGGTLGGYRPYTCMR